jgi:hypothetical protein
MRGIATGDNAFFFLTRQRAEELEIPPDFLKPAIGRTRDLIGDQDEVTTQTMKELEQAGRPTVLFAPDGRALWDFPEPVRRYLEYGQAVGVHTRPLLSQRNPWYKMEFREPPPFLFAYLGRRRARFISNHAGVVPLTAFLCVYPRSSAPGDIEFLGGLLSDPRTVANLTLVGKSYGAGAIKVEPRALDRLPLPVPAPRRSVAMPASVEQGVLPFR